MKKIIITLFFVCFLFCFMSVTGYADELSTEAITEEVTEFTTIEETELPAYETTLSDINHRLLFIIFGQFCLVGILIGQGFSFWKW